MTSDAKITELLVKLNRLTSADKIKWQIEDVPHSIVRGTDDIVPLFMTASYKAQRFALFLMRSRAYDGERDQFYWTERTVLAILDREDRVLWESPSKFPALYDLFETVRKKVSNIDGVLDDLLSDDTQG